MDETEFNQAGGRKLGVPATTGLHTCFPGGSRRNREIDYWVVGGVGLGRVERVEVRDLPIKTHRGCVLS